DEIIPIYVKARHAHSYGSCDLIANMGTKDSHFTGFDVPLLFEQLQLHFHRPGAGKDCATGEVFKLSKPDSIELGAFNTLSDDGGGVATESLPSLPQRFSGGG